MSGIFHRRLHQHGESDIDKFRMLGTDDDNEITA